jgi:hypothetical protein
MPQHTVGSQCVARFGQAGRLWRAVAYFQNGLKILHALLERSVAINAAIV